MLLGYQGSKDGWLHPSDSVCDAERVAVTLEAKGFEVMPLTNSNANALETQVENLFTEKENDTQARVLSGSRPVMGWHYPYTRIKVIEIKKPTFEKWGFWGQVEYTRRYLDDFGT